MSQPMSYSRGMSPSQTHSSYYSNATSLSNGAPGFQPSDINSLHFTGQQSDKHLGSPVPPRIPSTYPIQNSGRGNSISNNDYSTTSHSKPTSQTSPPSAAEAMSSFNHEGLNFPLKMLAECTPARGSQFVNQYGFSTDTHDITPHLDMRERIEHPSSDYLPAVSCNNFSTDKRTSTDGSDTPFPDPVSTKHAIQNMQYTNLCHDKVQENNEKNVGFAMKDSISEYRIQRYPYSELYQPGKMPQKNQSNICQSAGYNYQKLTPAESNSSLGASFLGIKPYRSFSSELNSPDLPLTDDIDMDFEFSLSTGIGEAGFDNFMAHDTSNNTSNFQSNSGNRSMGNGQNRCHSGSTYIEGRINNNNSHNVKDNGINTSDDIGNATFINNLKTESPDSMENLSLSGFLSGDSSATDKKEIHNFKTESGKSACEFASPDNNMSAFMSLSSRNPSPGYLSSSSEFWSDNRTHTPKSNNVTSSNCNDPSLLTNQNCPNNIQTSFFDDGNLQSLPPRSDILNNGNLRHDSLQNENLDIGNFLMLDRKLSPAFSERNNTPYSENPYSMSYYVGSNDMEPVSDTYNHWHGNSPTTHVTANRKSWLSHDTNYISSYRDKFGVDSVSVSEMQASGTEDLMPSFVKSEPGFSTGLDHAAATDPNSICNNHISSTTPGINGSYDNNMDENNSKTPKDYDCDIDTVNRSLIPTTVSQTDRKRASSDAGRRALVAFLHQQSGTAESRPEGLSASMVNSAIQHILQNRPSVDSIPSTRESSHKTSRLARSFEAQLKDIGDDNNDDDDVVNDERKDSKRRKSTRGSSEDVSTTTSTPSPLAPSSSSSPPIPLTATGSFSAAPAATSRKKSASSNESNGNSNVSSSSKPEKRRPSVLPPCRVCYSKASGLHYGVVTCEACNGFFRRSLKRGAIYLCSKDKTCDVRGKKRGECSYCRYQKCLAVGMSKSAVKTGRYSDKPAWRMPWKQKVTTKRTLC